MLIVLHSIPSTFHLEHCLILIAASCYFANATEVKIGEESSDRNSSAVDQGPAPYRSLSNAKHSLLLPRAPSTARYTRSYPFDEEMESQCHYA